MRGIRRAALVAALLLASACADDTYDPSQDPIPAQEDPVSVSAGDVQIVRLDVGGTTVFCAVFDGFQAGGITCDWAALHEEEFTP